MIFQAKNCNINKVLNAVKATAKKNKILEVKLYHLVQEMNLQINLVKNMIP